MFQRWMREMLSIPVREFPQLPAALAFLDLFSCDDVVRQLRTKASAREQQLSATAPVDSSLPQVFLIEDEYLNAMTQAELHWDPDALLSFAPSPSPSR